MATNDVQFYQACISQLIEDGCKAPNFAGLHKKLPSYSHVGSLSNKWYAIVKKAKAEMASGSSTPKTPEKSSNTSTITKSPRKMTPKKRKLDDLFMEADAIKEEITEMDCKENVEHELLALHGQGVFGETMPSVLTLD